MNKIFERLKLTPLYEIILPIIQRKQLHDWLLRGKKPPTPHLIKQKIIRKYASKYSVKTFVETGTYLGTMVNAAKNIFNKIYTIELDKLLYMRAKKKFSKFEYISVLFGDSAKVLPVILRKINKPTLFWLDAHYSGGITAKGKLDTPVIEEIKSILNHKIKGHIILIDDASEFNGKNDYPTIKMIKDIVSKKYPNCIFKTEYNTLQIILNP